VVPIIGVVGFVGRGSLNIAIVGTSKAQNRAIGIVEIGRHLIDLKDFAIRVSGCTEAVDDISLHAARITRYLARIICGTFLGIIKWRRIDIACFDRLSDGC